MAATHLGRLQQEISRTNPWWRDPQDWAAGDPDLVDVRGSGLGYRARCLDDLEEGTLYLLRGPRRAGKTVAVKEAVESLVETGVPETTVVRIDAEGWAAKDLRTVVQNVQLPRVPDGGRRWWFFDEVTSVTGDWPKALKWLRDSDPEFARATVVLTGSNASGLTQAAGALAGRRGSGANRDRTLLPIGFHTFARLLDPGLPDVDALPVGQLHSEAAEEAYRGLLPWLDQLVRLWERYVAVGGFPVAVGAEKTGRLTPPAFVDDIFAVVFADAFSAGQLSTTGTTNLFSRLMEGLGAPLNMTKVADDVAVAQTTVARHIGYLRDAYLAWSCPQKTGTSWAPRPKSQEKLYAVDPLIARLAHLRNPERPDVDPTVLTEMQLGMAIRRRAIAAAGQWDDDEFLFHVRTRSRKEIDFVSRRLQGVALEGKYVAGGRWKREAATINASEFKGILATRSVFDSADDGGAWAVPAGVLAYLLDT